jgi:ubiquinone/menaquinone biosynthesis C-methylase UbiE
MSMDMSNFSVREQIREYWSIRAETYDGGRGHGIEKHQEQPAWLRLIEDHVGLGNGRKALDLATGTGEIAMVLDAAGFDVTGVDFAEPMLEKARSKARAAGLSIRFIMRDVEQTLEPDGAYDVLMARNLVWTLIDPAASFAEWRRLLQPGGKLLIVDADHVSKNWADRLHAFWRARFPAPEDDHANLTPAQWADHHAIVDQLHFREGARAEQVAKLLEEAGFVDIRVDVGMREIKQAQWFGGPWTARLRAHVRHRFTISCSRP